MAESTPARDRHHMPSVAWPLRLYRQGDWPRIYVGTAPRSRIEIDVFEGEPCGLGTTVSLTRQQARMLAHRINQCLDYTK